MRINISQVSIAYGIVLMPSSPYRDFSTSNQSQFDQMVRTFYGCGCIVTLMFAVILVSNYTDSKPIEIPGWVLVIATLMPCLGIYGSLRYKLRPSLRTFFLLLELSVFSSVSLVFATLLTDGLHGSLSWLYRDYLLYYGMVFVVILLITIFLPRLRRRFSRRIKEKCELLDSYSQGGVITGGELFRALIIYKGTSAVQSRNGRVYVAGLGAFTSIAIGLMAVGEGKYLLYFGFICGLFSLSFGFAMIILRRVFYSRYLVNDRVAIVRGK